MADFEAKVAFIDDSHVVYTAAHGVSYPSEIVLEDLTERLLERFNYWIGIEDTQYEREDLQLLGRILYQLLLPAHEGGHQSNLRQLFEAEYAQFSRQASDADRFRLTLELHEDAVRMAQYPWEFLFIPAVEGGGVDSEFFLAGERNRLVLTRFVPKAPPRIDIRTDGPLRILIILSHPQELPPIASGATRDVIKVIQKLEEFQDVEVRLEENKTHTELCQLMALDDQAETDLEPSLRTRFKPDIVHFIGHGKPNQLALLRSKEEIQADEDEGLGTKDAAWCDSKEILGLFANHTPRLVFLHACESATPGSVKSFSNLARDLVYSKIPSVVAMQYTITNKDAALFARTFYEEIRKGSRIDEAVCVGREALGRKQDKRKSFGDRRFGTPVVYFQEKSGVPLIDVRRLKSHGPSTSRPTPTVTTDKPGSTQMIETRTCPRCGCQAKKFCTECGLRFQCQCGEWYLNPVGKFCAQCQQRIVQPDFVPDVGTVTGEGKPIPAVMASSSFDEEAHHQGRDQLFPQGTVAKPPPRPM